MSESATLSVPEAAKVLGCGRIAAYKMAKAGTLPVLRIGRSIRVPRAALDELLRNANGQQLLPGWNHGCDADS